MSLYFVVAGKIYAARMDDKLKIYPEVKLYKDKTDGHVYMKYLTTGVKTKPVGRQICLVAEVLAQLGVKATVEPEPEPPKEG